MAGLTARLVLVFLAMRAVVDIGGYCAEGGPYVIETHCPEGVPLVLVGGIFGLFAFGGLMAWKGSMLGEPYGALVLLAWPALFLSLGWNFLEYSVKPINADTALGTDSGDLVTKLERLAALRNSGALSWGEFERAKKHLIDGDAS